MPIEIKECNLCHGSDFKLLFETRDRLMGIPGKFYLYECLNCHLRFLNPQPTRGELKIYYSQDYMPFNLEKNDWRDTIEFIAYKGLARHGWKKCIYYPLKFIIRKSIIIVPGGKLLDVGCGSGNFLKIARGLGMVPVGVDSYSGVKNIYNYEGITIYSQPFEEVNFLDNSFDIITLNHVFEHVGNPRMVLQKLQKLIKPGGTIILNTPNAQSFNFFLFRSYFQAIDSPRHLYLYTIDNIKKYCTEVGLKIQKIQYRTPITNIVFYFSMIYSIEEKFFHGKPTPLIRKLFSNLVIKILLYPFAILLSIVKKGDGIEFFINK